MSDLYQERYLLHQQSKKRFLEQIIKERHSNRAFSNRIVEQAIIDKVILDTKYCPSSCNRGAIELVTVSERDHKNLLGGILVGGIGWIHRASHILLIFADELAYKAKGEVNYMPYLDAGVVIHQLYLSTTSLDLKCCYVNPNVRDFNKQHFKKIFGEQLFCGAFALGCRKETK